MLKKVNQKKGDKKMPTLGLRSRRNFIKPAERAEDMRQIMFKILNIFSNKDNTK